MNNSDNYIINLKKIKTPYVNKLLPAPELGKEANQNMLIYFTVQSHNKQIIKNCSL